MTPARFSKLRDVLRTRQPDLGVLAEDVHKSHNVSAVLRTCDAVGVRRLHAVSPEGEFDHRHMLSGGAQRWVDVVVHRDIETAVAALKSDGWRLAAAHSGPDAVDFREIDYTRRTAIVLGSELYGPSAYALEAADVAIRVPMHGLVESLNVSVAAAVILFEAERQRAAAGMYDEPRLDPAELETTLFEWAYPEIAARCRARGLAYPPLDENGDLLANPLVGGAPHEPGSTSARRE